MIRFHDIEQNTEEWLDIRAGLINSSSLGVVMANYGKAFGEPAKKYASEIAAMQMAGKRFGGNHFENEHTRRGHEQEPFARAAYEFRDFSEVASGGYFEDGIVGASPDGLVTANKGAIEIKSVIPSVQCKTLRRDSFDPAYKWQLYCNLKMTGSDWIDFVSYCHDFVDTDIDAKSLFVHRIERDSEEAEKAIEMIDLRVAEFVELIEESKQVLRAA